MGLHASVCFRRAEGGPSTKASMIPFTVLPGELVALGASTASQQKSREGRLMARPAHLEQHPSNLAGIWKFVPTNMGVIGGVSWLGR